MIKELEFGFGDLEEGNMPSFRCQDKFKGLRQSLASEDSSHEMEWQATKDEPDDIINMFQGLHLSEEMDWTSQLDPVDGITQSLQHLHLEQEMDWMPNDTATGLIESLQCLTLGAAEEEMEIA